MSFEDVTWETLKYSGGNIKNHKTYDNGAIFVDFVNFIQFC